MNNALRAIATLPLLFTFTATFWYSDATKDIVFITLASIACYQLIYYRSHSRLELHWDWDK
ncbi:hypothetical protein [Vibrio alginolyticus]|uniref:hypothetical protein n=1 Tax=Vibrio alginolyticus TaxID=663 RepID=UPI000EA15D3C|nr:hypothetical protein [Vibrio alginolyticus]